MYNYLPTVSTPQGEKKIKAIRQIIKKTKLSCLTHFTRIDNLKSILQFGILPASVLDGNKAFAAVKRNFITLPPEWKGLVSMNLSFPDYKIFNQLQNQLPTEWAILLIDIRVLLDFPCYFFPRRASEIITGAPAPGMFLGEFQKSSDLKALFENREDVKREELGIPSFYPTDPTSEVLSFFPIAPSYITQVFFPNDYKFNQWVLHNTEFAMTQNRDLWAVGLEYFSPRSDYPYWKTKRVYSSGGDQ